MMRWVSNPALGITQRLSLMGLAITGGSGKTNTECRPFADLTFHPGFSAMGFYGLLHHSKTKACPGHLAAKCFLHLVKTIKDALAVLGRDAGAIVFKLEGDRTVFGASADAQLGRTEFKSVFDDVSGGMLY